MFKKYLLFEGVPFFNFRRRSTNLLSRVRGIAIWLARNKGSDGGGGGGFLGGYGPDKMGRKR